MQARQYRNIADTDYPASRRALNHNNAQLSDQQLEIQLAELFPNSSAEEVENFMRSLQRFGRQIAPVAQRALPGIIQGAAQGGMVAGPWGALAGALGGGAASLLSSGPRAQTRPAPSPPVRNTRAAVPATNAAPSMAPIQQLLALLARPETMQALSALLMSASGRNSVSVVNRTVPVAAFANAIAELAAEAAEAATPTGSNNLSEYLLDSSGQPRCDVANPGERARLLLADISTLASREYFEDELYYEHETSRQEAEAVDEFTAEDVSLDAYEQVLAGGDSL